MVPIVRATLTVALLMAVVASIVWGLNKWEVQDREQRCGLYSKTFGVPTQWDATFGCHAKVNNGWHQVRTSP